MFQCYQKSLSKVLLTIKMDDDDVRDDDPHPHLSIAFCISIDSGKSL
jgi:hypothetical protein